jgi:cytochrome P450
MTTVSEPGRSESPTFDFTDPELRSNPWPTYHKMRSECPVYRGDSAWWLFAYDDCQHVLRSPSFGRVQDTFRELYGLSLGEGPALDYVVTRLTYLDREDHARIRGAFAKSFSPRRIEALRPFIEGLVDQLLAPIDASQPFDVLEALAHPLPSLVICELLGVPESDRQLFDGWTQRIAHLISPAVTAEQRQDATAALAEEWEMMEALVEERTANPGDDLLSALIQSQNVSGTDPAMSRHELISNTIFLFSAGHQTTRDSVGSGLVAMLENREQYAKLAADPSRAEAAAEETLRFDPPVLQSWEIALEDTEISGVPIAAGDAVNPLLAAANRDPAHFDNPDVFDIDRADTFSTRSAPLAFSFGHHHCLGAALARMELTILFGAIARRYPDLQLATDEVAWRETVVFRGPVEVSVVNR